VRSSTGSGGSPKPALPASTARFSDFGDIDQLEVIAGEVAHQV